MLKLQKPSAHLLTVWRLRMLLVTILPAFLSACFLPRINWAWWLFTGTWVGAFLALYIGYYPIKLRKLAYAVNEQHLLIHCGVIYTRVKAMPLTSIQYLSIAATPLQRLFGICSLFVYLAGATAYIPGLTPKQAEELRRHLTELPASGGGTNG